MGMDSRLITFQIFITLVAMATCVRGHGMLADPASRSYAYVKNFNTPTNYQHRELFCGGFAHQWHRNGGKCGTCGDPYDGTRENEAGGKYATGVITGSYTSGGVMQVTVTLTAYHKGWFEFRLCPVNDKAVKATQECLDSNLLTVSGTSITRYQINNLNIGSGDYNITLDLPVGLTCSQCVLQWKYNTGNNWGCDESDCCVGCGPQEQFINCADIRITSDTLGNATTSQTTTTTSSTIRPITSTTTVPSTTTTTTTTTSPIISTTTTETASTTTKPITATTSTTTTTSPISSTTTATMAPVTSTSATPTTTAPSTTSPITSTSTTAPTTTKPITSTITTSSQLFTSTKATTTGTFTETPEEVIARCRTSMSLSCQPTPGRWSLYRGMAWWCKVNFQSYGYDTNICICSC